MRLTGGRDQTSEHAAAVHDALAQVRSRWETLGRLRLGANVAGVIASVWLSRGSSCAPCDWAAGRWRWWPAWRCDQHRRGCGGTRRRRPVPADRALARYIEEQCPALEDRLATAVEVAGEMPAVDAGIRSAMLADASRALGDVPLDTIVPGNRVQRARQLAAAGALALIAAAALWIEPGRQAFRAAALYAIPGRLVLHVSPGDARVKRGDPFAITVATTAAHAGIAPELTVTVGEQRRTVRMPSVGADRFAWRFDTVPATFSYSVAAAGRRSTRYTVTALDPPRVARIDLRYEFPEYTRMPPRQEEDGGDIYAPSGTRVTLSIHASKGTTGGALALGGGARSRCRRSPTAGSRRRCRSRADGAYRVALTDGDGLRSTGETEYFIHVLNDRPPDVRILRPAGDRQVTPLEEIAIEARADDDYGVGAFDLVYSVRGGASKAVPFEGDRAGLSVTGRHTLFLEDLDVKPGDFVTYYARVRDVARGRRATEARSDIFFLEVKPFEEEFAAAQSQAGGGSGNRVARRSRRRPEGYRRGDMEAGAPLGRGTIGTGRARDWPRAGRVEGACRSRRG